MHIVNTYGLRLQEGQFAHDEDVQFRVGYAVRGGQGSAHSAVVSIVLEPGKTLGEHIDSAEEVLFVVDGNVEIKIGNETARASRGSLAVVPPRTSHSIRNIGPGIARIVGFLASPAPMSSFIEPRPAEPEASYEFGGLSAEPVAA